MISDDQPSTAGQADGAPLRLRDLLALPGLGLRALPGTGDLDRPVRWAHVTELPDPGTYAGPGELVLTNGLWLEQQECAAYVGRLVDAGAAGLVFGLRESVPAVPPGLVAACRAAGLPLLQLPVEVPFTAVTRALAGAQAEQRQRQLLEALRHSSALTRAVLAGDGLRGVLAVLAGPARTPVALVDGLGTVLDHVGPPPAEPDVRAVAEGIAAGEGAQAEHPLRLVSGADATVIPVRGVAGFDLAVLYGRPVTELGAAERLVLEQGVRFLTVELAHRQALRAIEMRFAGEILDMVQSGPHRAGELAARLRSFGLNPDSALAVFCVIAPDTPGRGAWPLPDTAAVTDHFLARGLASVATGSGQDVVVVVGLPGADADPAALAEDLAAALGPQPPAPGPRIGVGRLASGHQELRRSLLQAREAARLARSRRRGPRVVSFADVGSYRLLLALVDRRTRRDFADAVLGPAAEYDLTHSSELLRSLDAFLASGMKWGQAADSLHIHVNTLRNRLAKLEALTGRDLGCAEDLADVFLALRVRAEEG
ncbi:MULTISPECIES: PucR family transcriptional regulator ligand-binding domain-containing protein [Streptomyces]|uniref:Helix-turn-helix domain-containing protein n=1 Tax=Streptomyces luteosporeus TaxID=173856 RepID=A0ABP6G2A5_9ACTN